MSQWVSMLNRVIYTYEYLYSQPYKISRFAVIHDRITSKFALQRDSATAPLPCVQALVCKCVQCRTS